MGDTRVLTTAFAFVFLLFTSACGGTSALATSAQLGTFVAGLHQVRTQLAEVMSSADTVAQNRLRQVDISLEARIKQMEAAAKGTIQMGAAEQERMFENVFLTLNELSRAMEASPREAFLSFNETLANIATLADALPLVDIPPAIFMANPVVLDPDAADHQVSFYGYFAGMDDGDASVTVGGRSYKLKRYPGKLAFDLASDHVKDDRRFLDMTIALPKAWWSVWGDAPTYHHRIYLRARKPFEMVVTSYQAHPDLWATVAAPRPFHRTANSGAQTNNGQETAANLYVELGGDTTTYDQQSALIVSEDTRLATSRSTPCDSCCPAPSHSYSISGDSTTLSWNLHAPNCSPRASGCPGIFDSCGGGGSNASVGGQIVFRVKRRGVPEQKVLEEKRVQMGRRDVARLALGTAGSTVKVLGTYLDGEYPVKVAGTVTSARTVESNDYFTLEIDPGTGDVEIRTSKH
jgi:hypothetical protein